MRTGIRPMSGKDVLAVIDDMACCRDGRKGSFEGPGNGAAMARVPEVSNPAPEGWRLSGAMQIDSSGLLVC